MSTPETRLQALLAAMPYAAFLGVTGEVIDGELITTMTFRDELIGNPRLPSLHGGGLGAFLEMTATLRLAMEREGGPPPLTIGVTVEYLRPGRPKTTYARAHIKRLGRRIANVHVEAWQDENHTPVALLQGRFMLVDPPT
jgi:uncharacterized protein (TIGR00369 family)